LEEEKQERIRKDQEMAAAKQNGFSILSNGGDDFKPRILQRPKPTVTILKRPDSSPALSSTSQNSKPQIKTLEQREKEYAEARLRILGSAVSEESPTEQK
jgi:SUZ domain